jgi:lipid-binding SYLF domain-containing protein
MTSKLIVDTVESSGSTVTLNDNTVVNGTLNADSLTLDTDLPVTEGGTGASSAAAARTNLDVDQAGTALAMAIALG